jgi:5-methylcytosine-specific restriction endonuclease McrA
MGDAETLIAAGAWAGLDTPVAWSSIVVPRIPYERPVVLDDQIESSFLHTRNTAIRRMRQVIGRGLRTPEARCEIYILDGRYKDVESFIPHRFQQQWKDKGVIEGRRIEFTLSRAERDPSVRKKALAHYGKKCAICDFEPRVDSQLEVHHLFPLANGGERITSIADVVVLCANCHRLAHSSGLTPLSVEEMKMKIGKSLPPLSLD